MAGIRKIFYFIVLLVFSAGLNSCEKDPGKIYAGEFTIDNTLYGYGPYYAIGFSFEEGKKTETDRSPEPDITVHAKTDAHGNVLGAYLDTPNLTESFALAGEFDNEQESKTFFDNLLNIETYTWMSFADDISEYQVYVFKTREGNYVKFRIRDLDLEDTGNGPVAVVTIEWRIQPDGSTVFPL